MLLKRKSLIRRLCDSEMKERNLDKVCWSFLLLQLFFHCSVISRLSPFVLQVGLIAARRTGRLRGSKTMTGKGEKE